MNRLYRLLCLLVVTLTIGCVIKEMDAVDGGDADAFDEVSDVLKADLGQGILADDAGMEDASAPEPSYANDWIFIEGGWFEMGSRDGLENAQPVHRVSVRNFLMLRTEVTVSQYALCVEVGACTTPETGGHCNWDMSERGEHPINCVDQGQAIRFASWAGGRLPTEAEWEYAARSGGRLQSYPWGDNHPTCNVAVIRTPDLGCDTHRSSPVCSKPGDSEQGVCDLIGNVWE